MKITTSEAAAYERTEIILGFKTRLAIEVEETRRARIRNSLLAEREGYLRIQKLLNEMIAAASRVGVMWIALESASADKKTPLDAIVRDFHEKATTESLALLEIVIDELADGAAR